MNAKNFSTDIKNDFVEGEHYLVEVSPNTNSPIRRALLGITNKKDKVGILYFGTKGYPTVAKVNYDSFAYLKKVSHFKGLTEDFVDKGRYPEEI